jgi:pilus assembly protein CpaB
MILRVVLFGLILCGLGGFGAIAWVMLPHNQAAAAIVAPEKQTVLVASHAIQAGALIKPEDLAGSAIEVTKLPTGHLKDSEDERRALVGGLIRRPLAAGDVLRLPGDVLRPSDHGFLAAVLSPGTRAVTVGVDMISGAAGLIWPGDHVDLILTQTLDGSNIAPGRKVAAETVLRDVRVIAIDQQIAQGATNGATNGAVDTATVAKTVTLEVSAGKAEVIQVATRLGRLSLTLRAADAGSDSDAPLTTTWAGDVSAALPAPPAPPQSAPASSVRVFQGAVADKEYKF